MSDRSAKPGCGRSRDVPRAPEAREYGETQAIEKAFASKTLDETAWAQQQMKLEAAMEAGTEPAEAAA